MLRHLRLLRAEGIISLNVFKIYFSNIRIYFYNCANVGISLLTNL